ncbi:hypothetical protein D3C86_1363910 [compost metagenome]
MLTPPAYVTFPMVEAGVTLEGSIWLSRQSAVVIAVRAMVEEPVVLVQPPLVHWR